MTQTTDIMEKLIVIVLSALVLLFAYSEITAPVWIVELTYCDKRENELIQVKSVIPPRDSDILIRRKAVPVYEGRLNVCHVRTVRMVDEK